MTDFVFLPATFSPPPVTTQINMVWQALVGHTLGSVSWPAPQKLGPEGRYDKSTSKTLEATEVEMLNTLSTGQLTAYVYDDNKLRLVRIPQDYWSSSSAAMSLQGHLFELGGGIEIPSQLNDKAVVLLLDEVRAWLIDLGVDPEAPWFPRGLERVISQTATNVSQNSNIKKIGRGTSSVKEWCISAGLNILMEKGGISPSYKQADLIRDIYRRMPDHWNPDDGPSHSSMKRHAHEAELKYKMRDLD